MMNSIKYALWAVVLSPLLYSLCPLQQIFDGFDPSSIRLKRVVVCGASSGIGEQMVYKYAEMGAHVVAIARRHDKLANVVKRAKELGAASATAVVGDMGEDESLRMAIESSLDVPAFNGEIDIIVLNHAIQDWGWFVPSLEELRTERVGKTVKTWPNGGFSFVDKSVQVNFGSFVKLATAALPSLVRGAESSTTTTTTTTTSTSSQIIAVSSGAGKVACAKQAVYAGTKHAILGFFDSLRLELENKRIPVTITTVTLGTVSTEKFHTGTKGDVSFPPPVQADQAAIDIIRGGEAQLQDMHYPLSQGLQVVAIMRQFKGVRWLLDRFGLMALGGRNVLFG